MSAASVLPTQIQHLLVTFLQDELVLLGPPSNGLPTRYAIFSEKKDFLHYTAFGRVWYGAKYSHRVWEQFAHTFEK